MDVITLNPGTTKRGKRYEEEALADCVGGRVSMFWIMETQARTQRITQLVKRGRLELEPMSFPDYRIVRFDIDAEDVIH